MKMQYSALMFFLSANLFFAVTEAVADDSVLPVATSEIVQPAEGASVLPDGEQQQASGESINKQKFVFALGELVEDRAGLVSQIKVQQQQIAQLNRTLSSLNAEQINAKGDSDKTPQLAQTQIAELQKQLADYAEQVKAKDKELADRQAKLEISEKALSAATTPARPLPKNEQEIRDYAVGTSMANDMLSLLKERAAGGVVVDHNLALAGIEDAFSGKYQVSEQDIKTALAASEKEVAEKRQSLRQKTEQEGKLYMAKFAGQPGVKKDSDGFLYRADVAGSGTIKETDTVSVVVTESLTNGTVLKDMEQQGTFISQPFNAYPPLFKKAIKLLKNHGTITLVVPPSLAYGDEGYPPLVSPGATLVYKLRIKDVMPASQEKK